MATEALMVLVGFVVLMVPTSHIAICGTELPTALENCSHHQCYRLIQAISFLSLQNWEAADVEVWC
jgi:hypothetical protein